MTVLLDFPIIPSVAINAAAVEQENAPASTSSFSPRSEDRSVGVAGQFWILAQELAQENHDQEQRWRTS